MAIKDLFAPVNRRPVMYVASALTVIAVLALVVWAFSASQRGATTFNEEVVDQTKGSTSLIPGAPPQSTSSVPTQPGGITQSTNVLVPPVEVTDPPGTFDTARPEGSIYTVEQLKANFSIDKSDLQSSVYETSTATATDLLKARATGVGRERFTEFLNASAPMPSIDEFVIQHSFASYAASNSKKYIKTTVWWSGKQHFGGSQIRQAATVIYLDGQTFDPVPYSKLPSTLKGTGDKDTTYKY